jgi:hypothetical protein
MIIELDGRLIAIEIKSGKTINKNFFKGFKYLDKHLPSIKINKYLVYGGESKQKRSQELVLPWENITEVFQ